MQLGNDGKCTREGSNGSKSVIDRTLSSPLESPLGLCRLAKGHEETGSDQRVTIWETKRDTTASTLPSKIGERIRWDINGMSEDDKDEAELLRLEASETRPILDDFSFCEDIESETLWIEENFQKILNQKARRIRLCARSKRWWNDTIDANHKAVSQAKRRQHELGGKDRLRAARKAMKTEIRKAKREMWQTFLGNAQLDDVWRALEFTKPAMNMAHPTLRDESGNTATSIEEKRQMLIDHAFPLPPSDPCNEYIFKPAGHFHKSISREIIAASVWGQASIQISRTRWNRTCRSETSLDLGPGTDNSTLQGMYTSRFTSKDVETCESGTHRKARQR
jgi:hypothetical protein